jgi:RNA polymerase sigma-70 factor (ECF subfamily)
VKEVVKNVMKDADIIDLFERRSEEAISETQKKYGGLCRHIATNALSCNEDVDECMNDVYLAVWNAIPPESPDKLSSFICKITRNLSLKKYQYNVSQRRNHNMKISMTELQDCLPNNSDIVSDIENREINKHISDFLRMLNFNDRNIFLRKYFIGDSVSHISAMFQFSESKVKSSLHRTRGKLRNYLIKKGVTL